MEKAILSWSGGKDSALALHRVLQTGELDVVSLLTTVNGQYNRISMHGVRQELAQLQARSVGLPITKVYVHQGSNVEYEREMEKVLLRFKEQGISKVVFGDIFLDDLRAYRDGNLAKLDMQGHYPLWKENTSDLIKEFLQLEFKTITCCINDASLTDDYCGRVVDEGFVGSLPAEVDPCGENGEFHTFCFDGPVFNQPVEFEIGEKVYKPLEIQTGDADHPGISIEMKTKGFWYCDLLPL